MESGGWGPGVEHAASMVQVRPGVALERKKGDAYRHNLRDPRSALWSEEKSRS